MEPTKRMVVLLMIQAAPPPRPACYSTDNIWRDWLVSAHLSGLRVARRLDHGKSSGERHTQFRLLPTSEIPYCAGCTAEYKKAMQKDGRCMPSSVHAGNDDDQPQSCVV